MNILVQKTNEECKHLGDWVAQLGGFPQARCYGITSDEALGKVVFCFGVEKLDITINSSGEKVYVRGQKPK